MNREQIIKELNVQITVDPSKEVMKRKEFLKEYIKTSGLKGFVLGISGGQDSTLAGRITQMAVEELREEGCEAKFIAMKLPYGVQRDSEDVELALAFIRPDEVRNFNIKDAVDAFENTYMQMGVKMRDFDKGNVKARTRMMAQYAVASEENLLVIGTDHAAEAVTGFFTKYGDGGADILPLSGLTKGQGKELLRTLSAPERLYLKAPTADLLDEIPGQADETELGVTYKEIDAFLTGGEVSLEVEEKLIRQYEKTKHKRSEPIAYSNLIE